MQLRDVPVHRSLRMSVHVRAQPGPLPQLTQFRRQGEDASEFQEAIVRHRHRVSCVPSKDLLLIGTEHVRCAQVTYRPAGMRETGAGWTPSCP